MMNIDEKKKLALEVIARLKQAYPDAACSLDYNEAWKLLVSVRLAAQCTDARVNMIVPKLYEKFPDVNALADAPVEEIEEIVRPCGLGKSKARDISACMRIYVTALCCTDVTSAAHARLRTVSTAACRISVHSAYNPHLCMLPCYDYTEGNASSGISLCISGGSGAVKFIGCPVMGCGNESFHACSA